MVIYYLVDLGFRILVSITTSKSYFIAGNKGLIIGDCHRRTFPGMNEHTWEHTMRPSNPGWLPYSSGHMFFSRSIIDFPLVTAVLKQRIYHQLKRAVVVAFYHEIVKHNFTILVD